MEYQKIPDSFPEITELRNHSNTRNILPNQLPKLKDIAVSTCFEDFFPKKHCLSGFESKLNEKSLMF